MQGYILAMDDTQVKISRQLLLIVLPTGSKMFQERTFGPIVPCQAWEDTEELIAWADNASSGLGACVWSGDLEKAEDIGTWERLHE